MIVSKNNSHATHNTRNHLRADVAGANLNIKLLFFVNENVHCLLMFEERARGAKRELMWLATKEFNAHQNLPRCLHQYGLKA